MDARQALNELDAILLKIEAFQSIREILVVVNESEERAKEATRSCEAAQQVLQNIESEQATLIQNAESKLVLLDRRLTDRETKSKKIADEQVASTQRALDALHKEIEQAKSRKAVAETEVAAREKLHAELEVKIKTRQNELSALNTEYENLKKRFA